MKKVVALFVCFIVMAYSAVYVSAAEYGIESGGLSWKTADSHDENSNEIVQTNEINTTRIQQKEEWEVKKEKINYYLVQKGDTLSGISSMYEDRVTVGKLMEWNELPSDLILIGQKLIVKGEKTARYKKQAKRSNPDKKASVHKTQTKQKRQGTTFTVEATAYTAYCNGCSGVTATGINLRANPNKKVIAVDPSVIPLGSTVYVEGYGTAIAGDTGGAIKGSRIDVFIPSKTGTKNWGRKKVKVTVYN